MHIYNQKESILRSASGKRSSERISDEKNLFFKISLGQWSLHRAYFGPSAKLSDKEFSAQLHKNPSKLLEGHLDPLNFAKHAREKFDIRAVEYVNTFYFDKAKDAGYLKKLKNIADSEGVESVLIMCDEEGILGHSEKSEQNKAVENHLKWIEAAAFLGCHAIRVNARSEGSYEEQMKRCAEGLRKLSEHGEKAGINILIENHGGYSSHGKWLADTIRMVNHPRCGSLPDFGNFRISDKEHYDIYRGTEELMPMAKGVSAKTFNFNRSGYEKDMDYKRLMKIVKDADYHGFVGIEYEGDSLPEEEGILKTKNLLIKSAKELSDN